MHKAASAVHSHRETGMHHGTSHEHAEFLKSADTISPQAHVQMSQLTAEHTNAMSQYESEQR